MTTVLLHHLSDRATLSVPEAGSLLGIGRDAAYAAAERGEIPVLKLGRSLRVPVPRLLELLGIPHTASDVAGVQPATSASVLNLVQEAKSNDVFQGTPPPAA